MKLVSTNPSFESQVLGEVTISTEEEIVQKVKEARIAQKEWESKGIKFRAKCVRNLNTLFEENIEEIASHISSEMGMPITQAREDVESGLNYLDWYINNAEEYLGSETTYETDNEVHKVFYEAKGVAAAIVPWNFPFSNFIWQAGQNLLVGNSVVMKHSENCPLVAKYIESIVNKSDIPAGVFSEVYGDGEVGKILVKQDIDIICFTGSTNTGKYLYSVAAEKFIPILMELGGSAAGIVFEDSNIDEVLDSIYLNKYINCGQVCDGLKRLIVHESKVEEVSEKLKTLLASKKVGIATDKATDIGPLVSKKQLERLEEQVSDAIEKGAKVVYGGARPDSLEGNFYMPTLLTNISKDMKVWSEEVFGPVLPIMSFKTYEEAIELANDTNYGLGGYIYTNNKEVYKKASKDLKTGMVTTNNLSYIMPFNPFGGYKKSGIGRNHGKYGFRELCNIKVVAFEK